LSSRFCGLPRGTASLARARAAAEAFPQDSDMAAGNRYHHVRVEHHRATSVAPSATRRNGRLPYAVCERQVHLANIAIVVR
jgi:hypothetical protein